MTLSSYRMHRIYLAATMGYGLGSDDPEELAYYKKLRKEMEDMKKDPVKKGIPKLIKKLPEGVVLDEERIENLTSVFPLQYLSMFEQFSKSKK